MPFIYYVLFNKKINDSNRLESRQWFYSLSDTYWTTNGPTIIFHHEVSPTLRHFLNTDIFGRKEFSIQRHSWLHLFGPSDICHHEEFSIQLQLPAEKVEKKRVLHHCSDIRLILNKSLTTSQHKQVTPCNWYFPNISGHFWVQGVFHPEIALAASFLTIGHFPPWGISYTASISWFRIEYQFPKYEKVKRKCITSLLK